MTIRSFAIVVAICAALIGLYLLFTRVCGCSGGVANSPWLAIAWFGIALLATAISSYAPGVEVPTDPELFKVDASKRTNAMWMMLLVVAGFVILAVLNFLYDARPAAKKAEAAASLYEFVTVNAIISCSLKPAAGTDPLCY